MTGAIYQNGKNTPNNDKMYQIAINPIPNGHKNTKRS
jgi:hypothetical protein